MGSEFSRLALRVSVDIGGTFTDLVVELGEDRRLPDHGCPVGAHEHRDRVAAGEAPQRRALLALDRDLARDGVDAGLGQPLPDALRPAAPLGLEQREHPVPIVTGPR